MGCNRTNEKKEDLRLFGFVETCFFYLMYIFKGYKSLQILSQLLL